MSRLSRKPTCSYIYTDGTLVQVFEETRNDVKIAETVDITRGWCRLTVASYVLEHQKVNVPNGRIVVHRDANAFVKLVKGARIEAILPSTFNGSPNMQSRGLRAQNVTVTFKDGSKLWWTETPDILSGNFTVQDTRNESEMNDERLQLGYSWGNARIWKITDIRPKTLEAAA